MIIGATREEDIAEMWKQHYSSLLNSSTDTSAKHEVVADLESLDIMEDYLLIIYNRRCSEWVEERQSGRDGWHKQ